MTSSKYTTEENAASAELKPCPFCGGKAKYTKDHTNEKCDTVWCTKCDCHLSDFNLDHQGGCVTAWNTRADTKWEPIETAPKDGTPIQVWADCAGWEGNFSIVNVTFYSGLWRIYGPVLGMPFAGCKTKQWLGEVNPTRWQPLSDTPE